MPSATALFVPAGECGDELEAGVGAAVAVLLFLLGVVLLGLGGVQAVGHRLSLGLCGIQLDLGLGRQETQCCQHHEQALHGQLAVSWSRAASS